MTDLSNMHVMDIFETTGATPVGQGPKNTNKKQKKNTSSANLQMSDLLEGTSTFCVQQHQLSPRDKKKKKNASEIQQIEDIFQTQDMIPEKQEPLTPLEKKKKKKKKKEKEKEASSPRGEKRKKNTTPDIHQNVCPEDIFQNQDAVHVEQEPLTSVEKKKKKKKKKEKEKETSSPGGEKRKKNTTPDIHQNVCPEDIFQNQDAVHVQQEPLTPSPKEKKKRKKKKREKTDEASSPREKKKKKTTAPEIQQSDSLGDIFQAQDTTHIKQEQLSPVEKNKNKKKEKRKEALSPKEKTKKKTASHEVHQTDSLEHIFQTQETIHVQQEQLSPVGKKKKKERMEMTEEQEGPRERKNTKRKLENTDFLALDQTEQVAGEVDNGSAHPGRECDEQLQEVLVDKDFVASENPTASPRKRKKVRDHTDREEVEDPGRKGTSQSKLEMDFVEASQVEEDFAPTKHKRKHKKSLGDSSGTQNEAHLNEVYPDALHPDEDENPNYKKKKKKKKEENKQVNTHSERKSPKAHKTTSSDIHQLQVQSTEASHDTHSSIQPNTEVTRQNSALGEPTNLNFAQEQKAMPCYICGETMTSRTEYIEHLAIQHARRSHQCRWCLHSLGSRELLEQHMEVSCKKKNSALDAVRFRCPKCPMMYTYMRGLDVHCSLEHNPDNKTVHKCKFCGSRHSNKSNRKTHERKCGSGLMKRQGPKLQKTVECQECGKFFSSASSRCHHVRIVHRKHLFDCVCGEKFLGSRHYYKHKKVCETINL